jgi:mono/diheme cytochrome c family protein
MCHGTDGAGSALGARLHVSDLRSAQVQGKSSAVLSQSISAGKNQMPAFGKKFDDQQIQALVSYIRQLRTDANPSPK